MSVKVQALIEAAQKLPPREQLNLISRISESLWRSYRPSLLEDDFWQPQTIEELVATQRVRPVHDIRELALDFWPDEESADNIIDEIYRQRREDRDTT